MYILFILLCTLVFPYYESSLIVFSWWVFRDTLRQRLLLHKSFHCTEVFCCLNVLPFILLCTLVFPFYESSLIVFSWWVFGDKLRQRLLLHKSFHCTEVCCCLNVHPLILLCTLVFLFMNHLWLYSHDEYSDCTEVLNVILLCTPMMSILLITSYSTVHK